MLGECEAGIYLVEKKEEKRENIIGGRFELLWAAGDHCDLKKRENIQVNIFVTEGQALAIIENFVC